jgi:RNA-directed DNA polymerase
LANFTLNGLESVIKPNKATKLSIEKKKGLKATSEESLINNDPAKLIVNNGIVRYADDFIIVTNSVGEVPFLKRGVEKFLFERGLQINKAKSRVIKWKNNSKFDFLGFTFHYLTAPYLSKVTMQGAAVRGGLYIYPSNSSVKTFKVMIKKLIQFNTNASPYKLIHLLNPIIRG